MPTNPIPVETLKGIKALVVMSPARSQGLVNHLEGCGLEVLPAPSSRDALWRLETDNQVQIVIADYSLLDNGWSNVLEAAKRCNVPVIISLPAPEPQLWIDMLEQGAYDVVVEPYRVADMKRIAGVAAAKPRVIHPQHAPEAGS